MVLVIGFISKKMKTNSLAFRLVILAAAWITAVVVIGFFSLSAIFKNMAENSFDSRLEILLNSLIAGTRVDAEGNLILAQNLLDPRFQQPYSGWYWQITDSSGPLVRSRSLWDQSFSPDFQLLQSTEKLPEEQRIGERDFRALSRNISLPGSNQEFNFLVTNTIEETTKQINEFNKLLFWFLGLLSFGLIIAVFIQVRFGLRPLKRIQSSLSSIRLGKAKFLGKHFPFEIRPLVREINSLLKHNSEVLIRTRMHVGNLAHSLKTPLSVLSNDLKKKDYKFSKNLETQTQKMQSFIDHYLSRAQTAASGNVLGTRTKVLPVLEDLRRTLKRIHADRSIELEIHCKPLHFFRGDKHDLEEMMGNLLDNACKWAKSRIWIIVEERNKHLKITVEDDGPGLEDKFIREIFTRGKRFDEKRPGSGLGLSIVRDTVNLYGGDVEVQNSKKKGKGLTVSLTFPVEFSKS